MRAPFHTPSQVALAAGLLGAIVLLAVLQWRWIGQWSAVEETRLRSNLEAGATDLDAALTQTLYDLAEALRAQGPADALPRFVSARYVVIPGPAPRLLRFADADAGQSVTWPDSLASWRIYFEGFPAAFPLDTSRTLRIGDGEAPTHPPGLAVPVLRPDSTEAVALRFAFALFDREVMNDALLPDLLAEHLVAVDQFDVLVSDPRGRVVYRSRPDLEASAFDHTDLDRPLGPDAVTQLTLKIEAGEINLFETARLGEGVSQAGRWRLRVRHRTGSISAAVAGLRYRQLAVAFGVLLVLALAVGLLVRSAQQARRLARRQMEFVAGVSHELRTPLAVIRSAGENLADGVVSTPDQTRRYGALVRDEGQRLSEMVENVLALAGADVLRPDAQPIDASDLVAEAVAQVRPLLDDTGSRLSTSVAPDTPAVSGARAALVAALRNLLANAARYGGPHVALRADAGTHEGRPAVVLTVSDDGPGLDPVEFPYLFEPFYRGQAAQDGGHPGSGLGLALVRRAAEAHGGIATAGNAPEGGSTFTLVLPAYDGEDS